MMPGISASPPASTISARVLADLADRGDAAILDRDIGADRVVARAHRPRWRRGSPGHASPSPLACPKTLDSQAPLSGVFYRRQYDLYCANWTDGYHAVPHGSMRLIRQRMDRPQSAGSTSEHPLGKGSERAPSSVTRGSGVTADVDPPVRRKRPGKPVGAVVAAAKVLRTLHGSERPLNASEVARAAGLHRGTAYNILRTLQAEGFVGYDEATRSYSVSLHILELALWRFAAQRADGSGAPADARDLRRARRIGLSVQGRWARLLCCCWTGSAPRSAPTSTSRSGVEYPGPAGASGVIMAAFGNSSEAELEALFSQVDLVPEAVLSRFPGARRRGEEIRLRGRSRRHVSGHHAGVGAGSVAVLGAAADPDRGGTFA